MVENQDKEQERLTLSAKLPLQQIIAIHNLLENEIEGLNDKDLNQLPHMLILRASDASSLRMFIHQTEEAPEKEVKPQTLEFKIRTRFVLTPEGIAFTIGSKQFKITPKDSVPAWEEWYTPDKTIEDLIQAIEPELVDTQRRRARPDDLAHILPIDRQMQIWTQAHLTGILLDTHTSAAAEWKYIANIGGFSLETRHGKALVENCPSLEAFRTILDRLGPEALQYELAALYHIAEKERRKHGELPEFKHVTATKIGASDLLRSMHRTPEGNTFSREQQMRPRNFINAASRIQYADVVPTHSGRSKLRVGPVIAVLGTDMERQLPLDEIPPSGEVISITLMPGEAAWELIRSGRSWCHPKLLQYHSINRKYEIAVGLYLLQLLVTRRNKPEQEWVSLGTIERESGIRRFDQRERRRLPRLEEALHNLAADGVIGGKGGKAIIKPDPQVDESALSAADAIRSRRLKLFTADALPGSRRELLEC